MSYKDFDEKIENEIVVLPILYKKNKFSFYDNEYEYLSSWKKIREKEEKRKRQNQRGN